MSEPTTDIAIVGAGLSGLLAAIALGTDDPGAGRSVTLIERGTLSDGPSDGRATALTPSALRMMARLGVGLPASTPLLGMRVGEGDTTSPWQFELPPRGDQPLAHIVPNADLRAALLARLTATDVHIIEGARMSELVRGAGDVTLTLDSGASLTARLVVAADGRQSAVRRMAGLSVSTTHFGQSALVTTVSHAEPHEGIALQRFGRIGAVASLPMANDTSQIIWSDSRDAVAAACALPEGDLAALIDERLWGALEVSDIVAPVQSYPLVAQRSDRLADDRVVLIGDAARVIHPLAGQGFNLSVRDVAALLEGVRAATSTGQDVGTTGLLGYARWRRTDETLLAGLTTGLASAPRRGPLALVGHLRRAAFASVDALPVLHPFIRQEAAGDTGTRPQILQ